MQAPTLTLPHAALGREFCSLPSELEKTLWFAEAGLAMPPNRTDLPV